MTKVFVGLSGGVDSSVAAALLKHRGYEVTGVFIKIDIGPSCDWRGDRREAMRAAARLEIPFLTLDLTQDYKLLVVDYLLAEYRAGRTPNPDVMCNKAIKFGVFFEAARRAGADYIATGHYARIQNGSLLTAKDEAKDQTYFLWSINPVVLPSCLFPIGEYRKFQVRNLAEKFGLPNASRPDSQGLCFLGEIDFKDFLAEFLPFKMGKVLDAKGQVIGEHRGAHLYTIGERHGFTLIKGRGEKTAPHFVVSKNIERNEIVVAEREELTNWQAKTATLSSTNWFCNPPLFSKNYWARIRYRAVPVKCQVSIAENNLATVEFAEPQDAVTPGQSCVIYNGAECLGGGVIVAVGASKE